MTPENFAEWLRSQGHRVVRTRSSYWFNSGPRVFQAFPYHWVIEPTEDELREFLCEENAIGLRYSTPIEAGEGACSYHIVYERATYDMKDVETSVRTKVRRGLEACRVGPISLERYAKEGWSIERDTQNRQHRHSRHGRAHWDRMVGAAADLDGFEAWGAEVEGRLAASIMLVQIDDCINMLYQQSLREFLPLRVNNALTFATTKDLVARPDLQLIHYGLHSLDAPASVDQFKLRLGYRAKPVRQRVVFHPRMAPWIGTGTNRFFERLVALDPENEYLQKTEGMIRFYCNGKLPIVRQPFPEILEPHRVAICRDLGFPVLAQASTPVVEGHKVVITPATPADLSSLIELHLACFSEEEHYALKLGRPFIHAAYRWFINSPGTVVLAARLGKRLVGFTALADHPYNLPMLQACKWQVLLGLLRRPWLMIRPDWLKRLASSLFSKKPKFQQEVAQIALTGVAADVQGHGIGRALKQISIQVCREWGVEMVITGVRRDNARAKAMYERAGFAEVPELSSERSIHLRLDLRNTAEEGHDE